MTMTPLMPMATAVWLVENTTLTFRQIANFCNLHEIEVQGIADGEVAKGIKPYNPIISGQLTREEIELSSKDQDRPLNITNYDIDIKETEKKFNDYQYGESKIAVAESVISYLEPINEKFNNLGDKEVDEIIRKNLELAKESAELTISEVEDALGIS